MTTIDSPWIKWNGGECPVPPGTLVEVKCRSGKALAPRLAYRYRWKHIDSNGDIVEYRTFPKQPDLEAAEKLLLAHSYTVIPPAKPLTFEDVTPLVGAPEERTKYWVLDVMEPEGVASYRWCSDQYDELAIKRRVAYLGRVAYLDREHAIVAAEYIFGLKGGAL